MPSFRPRSFSAAAVVLAVFACVLASARPARAVSSTLVLSQVYGGGGNAGATYTNDFIEVFNRGLSLINTTGMSVQYGATAGNLGANTAQITPLSGFVSPGQYLLVQEAAGGGGTTPLSPDITDPTPINMSATGGKVALVSSATGLNCGATATPCGAAALAQIKRNTTNHKYVPSAVDVAHLRKRMGMTQTQFEHNTQLALRALKPR